MERLEHGQQMGCCDQNKPEIYTEEQLSRLYDLCYAAEKLSLEQEVFKLAPEDMKLEYNYPNWKYQSDKSLNEKALILGRIQGRTQILNHIETVVKELR